MPLALRKIDRRSLWLEAPDGPESKWLRKEDLQADALLDIKTVKNSLSIWILDRIPVERVIGALAVNRDNLVIFDYILFDVEMLRELRIQMEITPGTTRDVAVNACHRDLVQLTAMKLAEFGTSIRRRGHAQRKLDQEVGRLINASLRAGHIMAGSVRPEMLKKLTEPRYRV